MTFLVPSGATVWASNLDYSIPSRARISGLMIRECEAAAVGTGDETIASLLKLASKIIVDVKADCTGTVAERFKSGMINAIDTFRETGKPWAENSEEFAYLAMIEVRNMGDDICVEMHEGAKREAELRSELERTEAELVSCESMFVAAKGVGTDRLLKIEEMEKERERLNSTINNWIAESDEAKDETHEVKRKLEKSEGLLETAGEKLTELIASRAEVDGLLAAIKTLINMERDPFGRKFEAIKAICNI